MSRFRQKSSVFVDAVQFAYAENDPEFNMDYWPAGVLADKVDGVWTLPYLPIGNGKVLQVRDEDWIVTFADGTKQVIKPDIFAATYEPAE